MLKISEIQTKAEQPVIFPPEGRIVGPWVSELRQVCDGLLTNTNKVSLDLADVSFADENGVAELVNLKQRGVELLNATPFLFEQLKPALRGAGLAH